MLENKLFPVLIFGIGLGFLGNNYAPIQTQRLNYEMCAVIPKTITEILKDKRYFAKQSKN